MFLTCFGCSGQKYALIPDESAPHNPLPESLFLLYYVKNVYLKQSCTKRLEPNLKLQIALATVSGKPGTIQEFQGRAHES